MTEQVSQQETRLEDTATIFRMQLAYSRCLDTRDFEGLNDLFLEDGEWIGGFGQLQGRQAIVDKMREALGPVGGAEYHVMTNQFVVELEGDAAKAECTYLVITRAPDDSPYVRMFGRYDDELVRTDDGWRFVRRTVTPQLRVPQT